MRRLASTPDHPAPRVHKSPRDCRNEILTGGSRTPAILRPLLFNLTSIGGGPPLLPGFDLFGKAGVARLHSDATQVPPPPFGGSACPSGNACLPVPPFRENAWSTDFAFGAGVEARMRRLALRLEYERIQAPGGAPDLVTLGLSIAL